MSGSNHTVPSAPLDLTNKTRERGSCSQGSTDDQTRTRHTAETQVESAHKCTSGQAAHSRDTSKNAASSTSPSDDTKVGQTRPTTPHTKCDNPTDRADSSFSKLPIRKRPFPAHSTSESGSQNKLKEERCSPAPKAHTSPSHSVAQRTANDHERDSRIVRALPTYCKLIRSLFKLVYGCIYSK